jgi:hypothetical protein
MLPRLAAAALPAGLTLLLVPDVSGALLAPIAGALYCGGLLLFGVVTPELREALRPVLRR